jgi:hypothetical protein
MADVLAEHYLTALELTRAAGQAGKTDELEAAARRYLALAGERALALDVASAEASLAKGSRSPRPAIPSGLPCSSAGRKPPSSRADTSRRERRSRKALALYWERNEALAGC